MRICIGGKNNIAVDVCDYILAKHPEVPVCFIPNKTDDGLDRFQRSFAKYARKRGLKEVSLIDVYGWEDLIFLSLEFDRLIRTDKFVSKRLYNIHFSPLPKYKGMYTSALPILKGEVVSGVTFHCIDRGIDTGDIIDQEIFPLEETETSRSLYKKYIEHGTQLVINNIDKILYGTYNTIPQPIKGSTYYSRVSIDYSNLVIDLNQTAENIERQIRAYHFREYQIPRIFDYPISHVVYTNEKSPTIPATVLEDNVHFIKITSIDYNVLLYKDRFEELLKLAKNGFLEKLITIPFIEKYVNEREKNHGWDLLMVAVYNNRVDIAKYLLENGFDVNARNYKGTSVLMYGKDAAINSNDYSIIDLLISRGADVNIKDFEEKSVFDYLEPDSKIYRYLKGVE